MQFQYRGYSVKLVFLQIEYPSYPRKNGERAVSVYQLLIDDYEVKIVKGDLQQIVKRVKYHLNDIDSDDMFFDDSDL
jgi:hypothetical protein